MSWKSWLFQKNSDSKPSTLSGLPEALRNKVLKHGPAARVIFFYPGEEGTYVDRPVVTLFENGIVHIRAHNEETTTHLQNCEILWEFSEQAEERSAKVRLLKPKTDTDPRPPESEL